MNKNPPDLSRLTTQDYYDALESLSDAIVCVGSKYQITHINSAARKLFGADGVQQILGHHIDMVLPLSYRRTHRLYLRSFLERNASNMTGRVFRLKLMNQSGQLFPATVSISQAHARDGNIFIILIRRRLASSFLTITEYATNFLGTSISAICHEIRNPLVSIGGFARRVGKDPLINPASKEMLDIVQYEVARLERLVKSLNDLSKTANYNFEYENCALLLQYASGLMNEQAQEEGKSIVFSGASRLPLLWVDKDRLSQVLINILRNALQASPEGGRVLISLSRADKPGYAMISVKDQGRGIAPEHLPEIFKPFFTTTQGGTGLGLAMARRIVEDHGGYMAIKSELGQGTEVMIYLPLQPTDN
ncbi:MAG: PAS domain S-box protein [Desulfarculales bacterium]|jgi:PAS domain S-box-containing protein|nr:PAS domain S-box protein [Desulfarculales bacterium]